MQNADATWVRQRASTIRMSPVSRQICHSARWGFGVPLRSRKLLCDLPARKYRLVPGRRDLFAAYPGGGRRYRRHLAHRFQRVRRRLRAIEIAAINERSARVRCGAKNHEQKKRQPFHSVDANKSVMACQCPVPFLQNAIA